ncbi:MAG: hypothetical protein NZ700_07930 [Gemmataceae bacterium]|nr:hypothetical protein [Gemmataceae bacterium]MDW8265932.1 hypothetical protein [Gemmataceae bacterium]
MNPHAAQAKMIREADIVVGVDEDFGNRFILFGRDLLQRIRDEDYQPPQLRVVHCTINETTNKLKDVLATIASLRGRHDFNEEPDDLDAWADEFLQTMERGRPPSRGG